MNLLTKGLVATAVVAFFGSALAASPRNFSFDEVVKQESKTLRNCKKERGFVSTIKSATQDKRGFLTIMSAEPEDNGTGYELKAPATAEQLKSLIGKKTCFIFVH
jgi:hypothetical protein